MERIRLNLVISPRGDPSLHGALVSMAPEVRAARLKELALSGLLGLGGFRAAIPSDEAAVIGQTTVQNEAAKPRSANTKPSARTTTAQARPATAECAEVGIDLDGQLSGDGDLGLDL
jgi:hypothetical protein